MKNIFIRCDNVYINIIKCRETNYFLGNNFKTLFKVKDPIEEICTVVCSYTIKSC